MKLYHYSSVLYPELLTRTRSRNLSQEEQKVGLERAKKWNQPGSYNDHISFFFDPIPLEVIGKLFGPWHHTWFDGNKLFEYVVDTKDLADNVLYDVVESPQLVKMLDETEWQDNDIFVKAFFQKERAMKLKEGLLGNSRAGLDKQIKHFMGGTEAAYRAARQRPDAEENKDKYAAAVPHLMLYPATGSVSIESTNTVVIGRSGRKPLKSSFESLLSHQL